MEAAKMNTIRIKDSAARRIIALIVLISMTGFPNLSLHAQMLNEDTLKSNYLIGFIDFIHWERETKNPIIIGLVGDSTLEREIQIIADKKKAAGASRGFVVTKITDIEKELPTVDVIFLPKGSESSWPTIIPKAKELGILTVGDSSGFLEAGGLIEFVIKKNRLRFTLNLEAAEDYRMGFSSKLARLAVKN